VRPGTGQNSIAPILVTGSIITALTLGVRATMGLFPDAIDRALDVGIGTVGLTVALQNLVWGLGQPLAGAVADRFGAARTLLVGAVAYAGGLLVMATANGPAGLHLGGGVIVGLGMSAASFAVVLSSMSRLVDPQRRSMALGVATACGSLGHFVLVPLTGAVISAFGWRSALTVLAVVTVSIGLFVRPLRTQSGPAEAIEAVPDDDESLLTTLARAARHRDYLLVNCTFFVCGFHVTFIGVHLPKTLTDAGLETAVANMSWSLVGLFNIVGAFAAGALGMRFAKSRLLSIMYSTRALAFAGLVLLPATPVVALAFGVVIGIVWLASVPLTSGIVLGQFGVRRAGTLFGFVFLSHQVGAFLGSWGGGEIRELTGSYDLWWWLAAALGVAAAAIHFSISEEPAPPLLEHRRRTSPSAARDAVAAVDG